MKKIILIAATITISFFAKAQNTTVMVIGDNAADDAIKESVREYFVATYEPGFQQVKAPKFLITDKSTKAAFTIGGFVNFRTAYDFNQVLDNLDFVTYQIPMVGSSINNQRVLMDGSTSRLYFKTVVSTRNGPLVGYIETDFRGPGNSLRLREAYVSYYGFTLGQTTSTFCDLGASFNTIDFEGPNAYTYGRNLMVQYKYKASSGFSFAVAAEYPVVSATYGNLNKPAYQRMPDIPAYVQYAWSGGASHIRASGIVRNMSYLDQRESQLMDKTGWGAQLSGTFKVGSLLQLYGQALYGEGITPYIQDLQGVGLDLVPNHTGSGDMQTVAAMAWLAGAQINITRKMPLTVGYSQVTLFDNHGDLSSSDYRIGQYLATNLFYNFSPLWSVGVEYLYGTRINFSGQTGAANRVQACIQLNF